MRYLVKAEQSRFTVQAFAKGLLSALGHSPTLLLRGLTGEVEFDAAAPERAALSLCVAADSLVVLDKLSEADQREIERRAREEVLAAARYPEVVFHCTNVSAQPTGEGRYRVKLNGELSLHGVARAQTINANVLFSGESLHARGGFTLRQSDYGIRPVTALGGAIKLKDELEFAFDICADRS